MKQPKATVIALIVICITAILVVIQITREDLCEVRLRTGHAELAVFTAYESVK